MIAPQLPGDCTGDCDSGERDCTCGRAVGMWDTSTSVHWRWYLLAAMLGVLSAALPAVLAP